MVRRGTGHGPAGGEKTPELPRQYVNFAFYRVDPAWRRLPQREREVGKKEFKGVVEEYAPEMLILPPGKSKYLFVYPVVKTRDWYRMTQAARQGMMDEHIEVGTKYRSVKLNTTYSFGLDDQEFVVAFETDKPGDFLDLVMEMRGTEASRFTLRDTPTFTCLARSLDEALDSLG